MALCFQLIRAGLLTFQVSPGIWILCRNIQVLVFRTFQPLAACGDKGTGLVFTNRSDTRLIPDGKSVLNSVAFNSTCEELAVSFWDG